MADASAASLHAFVNDHVAYGTRVVTDGWQGYRGLEKLGYAHEPRSQRAPGPVEKIPASSCWPSTGWPH